MVPLKVRYADESRRLSVAEDITYSALQALLRSILDVQLSDSEELGVYCSNNFGQVQEATDAIRSSRGTVVRLYVALEQKSTAMTTTAEEEEKEEEEEEGEEEREQEVEEGIAENAQPAALEPPLQQNLVDKLLRGLLAPIRFVQSELQFQSQLSQALSESLDEQRRSTAFGQSDLEAEALAKYACAEARKILEDSMIEYKRRFPAHKFEQFLQSEWPQDFDILLRARAGDPACTRSYCDWQVQYDSLDAASTQTMEQILEQSSGGGGGGGRGAAAGAAGAADGGGGGGDGGGGGGGSGATTAGAAGAAGGVGVAGSAGAVAKDASNTLAASVAEKLHIWLYSGIGPEHGASPGDFADRSQREQEEIDLRAALAASLRQV